MASPRPKLFCHGLLGSCQLLPMRRSWRLARRPQDLVSGLTTELSGGVSPTSSGLSGPVFLYWFTHTISCLYYEITHLMAEVLLPTGLTGRGLITGKSAWLLTRAPFWITPRGTERKKAESKKNKP